MGGCRRGPLRRRKRGGELERDRRGRVTTSSFPVRKKVATKTSKKQKPEGEGGTQRQRETRLKEKKRRGNANLKDLHLNPLSWRVEEEGKGQTEELLKAWTQLLYFRSHKGHLCTLTNQAPRKRGYEQKKTTFSQRGRVLQPGSKIAGMVKRTENERKMGKMGKPSRREEK